MKDSGPNASPRERKPRVRACSRRSSSAYSSAGDGLSFVSRTSGETSSLGLIQWAEEVNITRMRNVRLTVSLYIQCCACLCVVPSTASVTTLLVSIYIITNVCQFTSHCFYTWYATVSWVIYLFIKTFNHVSVITPSIKTLHDQCIHASLVGKGLTPSRLMNFDIRNWNKHPLTLYLNSNFYTDCKQLAKVISKK